MKALDGSDTTGTDIGLACTMGEGNNLAYPGAACTTECLKVLKIIKIISGFGRLQREMFDEQRFCWLRTHKS